MLLLSPPRQHRPQPEDDDAFALADSFINIDYEPDLPPEPDDNRNRPEPFVFGSGGTPVAELEPEPEPEGVNVEALGGGGGGGGGIGEGIEIVNLVSDEEELDDEGHESDSSSSSSPSSSISSTTIGSISDGKNEDRDDNSSELEEGEIRVSDDDPLEMASPDNDSPANELEVLPPVPPVNVTLEPHHQMLPAGFVSSVLYTQVIVEGAKKHDSLNKGSILWVTESRTLLGLVDEIFGPVEHTYYVVRHNSVDEVPKGIHKGTLISFVPEFAKFVLNSNKDLYEKGYDASDKESSDEMDFSDDDKEAEYNRKQRMTKRDIDDQNRGKGESNGNNFPPNQGVAPTFPVAPASSLCHNGRHSTFSGNGQGPFGAPAAPMRAVAQGPFGNDQGPFGNDHFRAPAAPFHDHGHCHPFSGNGQHPFGAPSVAPPFPRVNHGPNFNAGGVAPPFPHANHGPDFNAGGVWTNGATTWQLQPQPRFPASTQFPHQFPVSGPRVPFQQQFNPSQVFPPRAHPNMYARPIYAQGFGVRNQMPFELHSPFPQVQPPTYARQQGFPGVQNQMPFELNSPFPWIQPSICAGQQGFPSGQWHAETNCIFAPDFVPFNPHAPPQFNPGAWDIHGKRSFD